MNFIRELQESRLTRDQNNVRSLTYTDASERLYISILVLQVLHSYEKYRKHSKRYASKTILPNDFNKFRIDGTDLYNFTYFVTGPEEAQDRLKNPGAAKELKEKSYFPLLMFRDFLKALSSGKDYDNLPNMLIKIEDGLSIKNADYKEIRRRITSFNKLASQAKKDTVTKLLFSVRAKLRNSDIIQHYEELVSEKDLESVRVTDTEPVISIPDISTVPGDLIYYQYLVGSKNLALLKRFLDMSKNNQSVSKDILQAYMPIIELVDNIVKAGPGFVQRLKTLEQRAKNQRR